MQQLSGAQAIADTKFLWISGNISLTDAKYSGGLVETTP